MADLTLSRAAPPHVPAELVWPHDINAFARELDDPFEGAARLFDGPDILWAQGAYRGQPGWLPTRYTIIRDVLMDADLFSSAENGDLSDMLGVSWRQNPLEIDPPQHMIYRQILQPWFQPSAVNRLEPMVRDVAGTLIEAISEGGPSCEFVRDFASLLPSYIFLALMGMPREMLPQFLVWEDDFMRAPEMAQRIAAAHGIMAYMAGFAEERRAKPRDDLVSHIVTARLDGRLLDEGEVMGMLMVLYLGGLDTVMSSLGWYFLHLTRDGSLQTRLRERPADIPGAVDDFLRAYGVTGTRRTLTRDTVFHGITMKKGDAIIVPTYLAGRDPREYREPARVDPDRKARHLTLATGIHNCLGVHLAKQEIRVVIEEWLKRFRNIRLAEDQAAAWHTDGVWGVHHLPLTWDC